MNKDIKKRKKRFWALCLVTVMMLLQTSLLNVFATDYWAGSANHNITEYILHPNDTVNMQSGRINTDVTYYDMDGTVLYDADESYQEGGNYLLVVKEYSDEAFPSNRQMPDEQFKEWEVITIYASSGWSSEIALKAVPYNQASITYYLNGGINASANPDKYYEGKKEIVLADATKEGYTFEGWYSDSTFTTKVTSISTTQTGNVTLYAKWTVNTYSIAYDGNGSTGGSMESKTGCTYGTTYALDENRFERTGYSFAGWNTKADGTGTTYSDRQEVSNLTTEAGETVTLYAQWATNTYNIIYELDGGTNGEGNPSGYTYGIGVGSFADAAKEGYTFEGWYSDNTFAAKITSISTTQTGNVTLYAKFKVNDYTITYELDGGTNGAGNPTGYTYGIGVGSFADAVKEGYTFDGWYGDNTFAAKVTSISATNAGNVTLYAKFTRNTVSTGDEPIEDTPDAGDNSPTLWKILLPLSVCGMICVAIYRRKKFSAE